MVIYEKFFIFYITVRTGFFSFVIVNFVTLEENYELLLDNSGPYIGAEFPKAIGFYRKGHKDWSH